MVIKMALKSRNGKDSLNSLNLANLFLFSTLPDFMFYKNDLKIVQFLKVGSKACL